jgi:hypothetical protein
LLDEGDPPLWLWPNILSLDAPFIAVLWQWLLARTLHIHLGFAEMFVLGACVWLIYAADHFLDVLQRPAANREPRRKAIWRREPRLLLILAACVGVLLWPAAFSFLNPVVVCVGIVLSLSVLGYFACVHMTPLACRERWPRELAVACVFTAGIVAPIVASAQADIRHLLVPVFLLALLCWANSSAVECWEITASAHASERRVHRSTTWIARHLPEVALLAALLSLVMVPTHYLSFKFAAAGAISGLALGALGLCEPILPPEILSAAAELALFSPLAVLVTVRAR